jgi:hypothetical protein
MTTTEEPKELFPITLFSNRPGFGLSKVDFRPKPVAENDALPPTVSPAVRVEQPDPKAISSATGSATPSENASSATPIPEQTISQSDEEQSLVSVEKVLAEQNGTQQPGSSKPLAEITGTENIPVVPARGPLFTTPSSPEKAKP